PDARIPGPRKGPLLARGAADVRVPSPREGGIGFAQRYHPFRIPTGEAPAALTGAPQATEEATPGFTPPATPVAHQDGAGAPNITPPSAIAPLPWQDACPPSSAPGEGNSWLYVPLLHAGAGTLSAGALQAWRAHPVLGPRFEELATTLRRAPPAMPRQLARSLLAVADCEADDARRGISADDEAAAAALDRLPDVPMPLQATMLLCMGPDGYLSAAAQSALLRGNWAQGRQELLARAAAFQRGDWAQLLDEARRAGSCRPQSGAQSLDAETVAERKREQACTKVRAGELSKARQLLTAAEIAPGNEDTWRALTDPARRPPEPRTPIPRAVVEQRSAGQVQLGPTAVAAALRDARREGAAGLSGMRAEHLKILLADVPALELLAFAATALANAHVPADIAT
ncbi:unnamed protein product, partial [Symbiodinium sp. KB8]